MIPDNDKDQPLLNKKSLVGQFADIFDSTYISNGKSNEFYREYFGANKKELLSKLRTHEEKGLNSNDQNDIEQRKREFGDNVPEEEVELSFFHFVEESLEDPMLRILLGASVISLIIGILQEGWATGWIEGVAIFFAVFIVVTITASSNYNKQKQFNLLNKETKKKIVTVRRDGFPVKAIDADDLLVGDILHLKIGDIVLVDGILIEGSTGMDESAATGESDLIKKTTDIVTVGKEKWTTPFILSGTQVRQGTGVMVVCAVGANTFSGRNREKVKDSGDEGEEAETPLKRQLTELANVIGDIGFLMAVMIGVLMIVKEVIIRISYGIPVFETSILDVVVNAFVICVTVIVVAIPEGLPMAVTISLAYSVMKMKEEKNLVKHIDKSETMGNVNNVCTDKTGTLTEGVMTVNNLYIFGTDFNRDQHSKIPESGRELIADAISSNISAHSEKVEGKLVARGDMTECALLNYLLNWNYRFELRHDAAFKLPFSSEYKYMVSIYKKGSGYKLFVKGAPERVSPNISSYETEKGKADFTSEVKSAIEKQQEHYANQCLRTLFLGYKDLSQSEVDQALEKFPEKDGEFFSHLLKDSTLLCLLGIGDPHRADVPNAILKCKQAGVTVRMVTGDNIKTAIAISRDVGIINESEQRTALAFLRAKDSVGKRDMTFAELAVGAGESPIALEGEMFRTMSGGYETVKGPEDPDDKNSKIVTKYVLKNEEKFRKTVKNLKVIARASPDDKFLLVLGLKKIDQNIVAVTGDGTNDAPALKQSHVGFAMGIRGTDIAKDAADIILLNDSFSSIVTAIKYGRNVYDCIRKFIQFQLTTNIVAVFMTLLGGIVLKDSPLNAIQMLWVNLIMDSFASLALATESPTDKLLERKPYRRDASILTQMMIINIVTQAVFQIIVLTVILFYGDVMFGVPSDRQLEHFTWNDVNGYHFTIFFNIFVFMQVFNSVNARKLHKNEKNVFVGIFDNSLYIGVQLFIIIGQVILVTVGGRAARTHALSLHQHLACLLIASLSLVINFIVKLIPFELEEDTQKEELAAPSRGKMSFGYASRFKKKSVQIPLSNKSRRQD